MCDIIKGGPPDEKSSSHSSGICRDGLEDGDGVVGQEIGEDELPVLVGRPDRFQFSLESQHLV